MEKAGDLCLFFVVSFPSRLSFKTGRIHPDRYGPSCPEVEKKKHYEKGENPPATESAAVSDVEGERWDSHPRPQLQ